MKKISSLDSDKSNKILNLNVNKFNDSIDTKSEQNDPSKKSLLFSEKNNIKNNLININSKQSNLLINPKEKINNARKLIYNKTINPSSYKKTLSFKFDEPNTNNRVLTKSEKLSNSSSIVPTLDEEYSSSGESELSSQETVYNKWEKAYFLADLALLLNDYKEGIKYADEMISLCETVLNKDQIRVFLGINFGYISKLRMAQRRLNQLIITEKSGKKMIQEIKEEKEKHVLRRSEHVIKLINDHILIYELEDEQKARFLKVKADFYRYMAEITTGHQLFVNKQQAYKYYNESIKIMKEKDNLNATKLNIYLNYSIFLNEILNKRINSFFIAKEALFNALKALKNLSENELVSEKMKDTLLIIETLNKNVNDWYKEEVGDIFYESERQKKEEEERKRNEEKKRLEEKAAIEAKILEEKQEEQEKKEEEILIMKNKTLKNNLNEYDPELDENINEENEENNSERKNIFSKSDRSFKKKISNFYNKNKNLTTQINNYNFNDRISDNLKKNKTLTDFND